MVRMKTSEMTTLSEGSQMFQQYLIIEMKITVKKILKVLKCDVFCVNFMTFYHFQNSVKLHPKMQEISGALELNFFFTGDMPRTRLDVSCTFVAWLCPQISHPGAATGLQEGKGLLGPSLFLGFFSPKGSPLKIIIIWQQTE